jgi:hypothetical protein
MPHRRCARLSWRAPVGPAGPGRGHARRFRVEVKPRERQAAGKPVRVLRPRGLRPRGAGADENQARMGRYSLRLRSDRAFPRRDASFTRGAAERAPGASLRPDGLPACPRDGLGGNFSKQLGSRYRSGRSPDWLKSKNPEAPAVRREAEEDWRKEKDRSDMKKYHAAVAAVAIGAVMFVLPADARAKKQKRPEMQKRYEVQTQTPSLDGRTLGRMRTCGFDYLQYDGLGTPYGPYCH